MYFDWNFTEICFQVGTIVVLNLLNRGASVPGVHMLLNMWALLENPVNSNLRKNSKFYFENYTINYLISHLHIPLHYELFKSR